MTKNPDEWSDDAFTNTAAEEAPTNVSLEVGDIFKGTYTGTAHVVDPNTGDEWDQYLFRAAPGQDGLEPGELCALGGYAVDRAFKDGAISVGTKCRLEVKKEIQGKNKAFSPLKSIEVRTA